MTRVGFWRQVERFFGPPSHALTAVRAVYIARSSGRCVLCGVKPETGLKLARLDPRQKQRTGWSLVAWVLRNDYPATMGMACNSCIARRGQDWSKPREKNAKARERAASRARQRVTVTAAPLPPAPTSPEDFVDPAKIVWVYSGHAPSLSREGGKLLGKNGHGPLVPIPEQDGSITVCAVSTLVDANTVTSGKWIAPTLCRLEQVSFDASPPPGWMWFVQGYWGDDYLTENEREKLFLWQHAGPDHVRIIPVRHHVSPSIVRTYAFARWCGGLNGGSLTARLMEKDATFRDEVKHIRSIVSGRDLPRVRQDAAPPPGLDWYVLEGTREDDRPKLWKRGCDATGAIDALRVMPDPPRRGSA